MCIFRCEIWKEIILCLKQYFLSVKIICWERWWNKSISKPQNYSTKSKGHSFYFTLGILWAIKFSNYIFDIDVTIHEFFNQIVLIKFIYIVSIEIRLKIIKSNYNTNSFDYIYQKQKSNYKNFCISFMYSSINNRQTTVWKTGRKIQTHELKIHLALKINNRG